MGDVNRRYDDMTDKAKGYAEGVVAGFDETKAHVEKLTNGVFSLAEPEFVAGWREVVRCLKSPKPRPTPTQESRE